MCGTGFILLLQELGWGALIFFIVIAGCYFVVSLVLRKPKFKKKYSIILVFFGVLVWIVSVFAVPYFKQAKDYLGYPGPAYQESESLKAFIESRVWREDSSCDFRLFEFRKDGTYIDIQMSDYTPPPTFIGTWSLQDQGNGKGRIKLNVRVESYLPNEMEVRQSGKVLLIDSKRYFGTPSGLNDYFHL